MRIKTFVCCFFITLTACSGQPVKVQGDHQIKAFYIKKIHLKLTESPEAIPGSTQFSSEATLSKDFAYSIHKYLMESGIYAANSGPNVGDLTINIDYLRRYKMGGHALSRPLISHQIIVSQGDKEVTQLTQRNYTPLYGYFRAVYVNIERAIHQWDEKDEHVDADNISESLVDDLERKFDL